MGDRPPGTGMATGSLVLGLLSIPTTCVCIGPVLGLISVILGIVAVIRAGGAPHLYGGQGRAIAGIVTGLISILLLVLVVPVLQIPSQGLRVGATVVDLQNVGNAVQSYHAVHDEYPPDLDALVADNLIAANPVPTAGDDPTAGMSYVTGLSPDDPDDWILAYKETEIFNVRLVAVLYNAAGAVPIDGQGATTAGEYAGTVEVYEKAEFAAEWARFKEAYEQARGTPPVVEGQNE